MTIGTKLPQAVLRPGMVFFWQTIDEVFGMIDSSREWNSSESFDFRFETERKRSNYSFSPKMTEENNEKKNCEIVLIHINHLGFIISVN